MKQIVLLGFMLLPVLNMFGQTQHVDSLVNVLETQELPLNQQIDFLDEICKFYAANDLEKGIKYSEKGLKLSEKENNKEMISTFNKYLGIAYYNKSSLDTSFVYLNTSLEWAIEAKNETLQAAAYGSIGNLYRFKQDNLTALDYYMKSLSLKDIPATVRASTLINVGVIHRILNNSDQAVSFFEQALKISEPLNLDYQTMGAIHGLANIYADKEDYSQSAELYAKTLDISRKLGDKQYEIVSIMSLASCLCANKEYEKALEYAKEGLHTAEEFNSPYQIMGAYATLADIYREMGRYKESEEMALKSWEMDSTSVEEGSFSALFLSIANIHLGQKEKAEYFVRKFYDIIKEGNDKSLHNSLADMEVKYETEKKELRIASLEKERRIYVYLSITGVLFAIALGIILQQKIKNARKEKQLIATRSVLEGEMKERRRLAQDLHDRLSGNLLAVKIELANHADTLQNVRDKLDNCAKDIRNVAHDLMPASLQFGLKVALEDFAAQFPHVRFHFFGEEKRMDRRMEFVVYCCANELVNNSLKHADAKEINLQLVQDEKHVTLTVSDNGNGFDEKTVSKGFGLKSIRDRVASCNGKMDMTTSPGKGTETTIELKIENGEE
ncbi:MAG: sensor histidine kinase [Tannerellaceae bacterium]|jgi:signal transduction histidine kinase|nr:sensor histidine kinase [Tannerellaceae bacterium]